MRLRLNVPAVSAFVASLGVLALTGCAMNDLAPSTPITTQIGNIQGEVHGGRQAITNARLFLMAVGNTSYGGSSISLIGNGTPSGTAAQTEYTDSDTTGSYSEFNGDNYILTDSNGRFNLGNTYTCTAGQVVYLVSLGGNTGGSTAANYDNTSAGLMAMLGVCPASGSLASQVPYVYISEASTMAAAYALAPYATDVAHISTSGTTLATTASQIASTTAYNLYNTIGGGSGVLTTPGGNGTAPQALIDSLGNSLAACVNSISPSSVQCRNLFGYTTSSSNVTPLETASAAINIALQPGKNVANIFNLPSGVGSPFQPVLTTAPNDFTAAIVYTGGLRNPQQVAIDNSGNAWVNNGGNGMVAAFTPSGTPFSGSPYAGGSGNPLDGLAIGPSGNIWVTNYQDNEIHEYNGVTGAPAGGSPFSPTQLNNPSGISFDALGNFYVANSGNDNVLVFNESAQLQSTISSTTAANINNDQPLAVDNTDNYFWIGNQASNNLARFGTDGTFKVKTTANKPYRIAIDSANDVWATNRANSTVYELAVTGGATGGSPYTGGGINVPQGIAIDGLGNAWIVNNGGNSLSEITNGAVVSPYSGFAGYSGSGNYLTNPHGIAIDLNGNIWVTNNGTTLAEFIGLGAPVHTPLVPPNLGKRP